MRRYAGLLALIICLGGSVPATPPLFFWKKKKTLTHEDSVAIAEKKMARYLRVAEKHWEKNHKQPHHVLRTHILEQVALVRDKAPAFLALGRLSFLQEFHRQAEQHLKAAQSHGASLRGADLYIQARCFHLRSAFEEAVLAYQQFLNQHGTLGKRYVEEAKLRLSQAQYANSIKSRQVRAKEDTVPMPYNTLPRETHPLVSADGKNLFFLRDRDSLWQGSLFKKEGKKKVFDLIRYAQGKEMRMPGYLTGDRLLPVAMSPDGRRILLTGPGKKKDKDLYVSDLLDGKYSLPQPLPPDINTAYDEIFGTFGPDNRTLFFISNRPGGQGGFDIWMSKQNTSGWWSAPENAGVMINTARNEYAVFLHADGRTVYLSSDGHQSVGEADILKSDFYMGKFSTPINLGMPINTPYPDLFFSITGSGRQAYMVTPPEEETGRTDLRILHLLGAEKQPVVFTFTQPTALLPSRKFTLQTNEETCLDCSEILVLNSRFRTGKTPYAGGQIQVFDHDLGTLMYTASLGSTDTLMSLVLPSGKKYGLALLADGFFPFTEVITLPEGSPYRLRERLVPLKSLETGVLSPFQLVEFVPGTATPTLGSVAGLEVLAQFLLDHPGYALHVFSSEGQGDGTAKARKWVIFNFLLAKGIPGDRLVTGNDSAPALPNADAPIYLMLSALP